MKIVQVGSNSIHVSSFLKALSLEGLSTILVTEEPCEFEGVSENKVSSFRLINPFQLINEYRKLKHYLYFLQPTIIHIHQVNRLAYFVSRIASKLSIPVITTAWGSDVLLIPKKNFFYKYLVQSSLNRSSVITADSEDMIVVMRQLAPKKRYEMLQYGIDPIQGQKKQSVIFSNRLHNELYRIPQIVEYFKVFQKECPDWKLVIGGSGRITASLVKQVEELKLTDAVEFVGWLSKEENAHYYGIASIYITIPESDGTSVSLLEAMSAGCVPVVSDLPANKAWIQDQMNGVIEKKNSNPLLEAISLSMEEAIIQNQDKVRKLASRQACVNQFIQLYQTIQHAK
jgi:glycosyltransferase involved in cell wall biosynthesis